MLPVLLITAFRNIRKNKVFTFLNIFGLGIGIACSGLIALWIESEKEFDRFHLKADKLYEIKVNMKAGDKLLTIHSTPRPMARAIKDELPEIAYSARYSENEQKLPVAVNDKSVFSSGRYTDSTFFKMFTIEFLQGDQTRPFPELYSMVITDRFAKKIFGHIDHVVGKTIKVDNQHEYTVSAVIRAMPENSTLQFEWLASYELLLNANNNKDGVNDANDWSSYGPITFVELKSGTSANGINKKLQNFIKSKAADQKKEAFLFPLTSLRLYNDFSNGVATGNGRISQVKLLAVIGWVILIIACINFMNLATAGSQKRAREVGVRKVLGAGRRKLVIQFLVESMLVSFIAMLVGAIFITLFIPAFNQLTEKNLVPDFLSLRHISVLVGITLICGLFSGIYPAFYLSSFKPARVLKGLQARVEGVPFVRKGLVVLQFIVSVVFIISTIIVSRQIEFIKNRDLGFNKQNLIEVPCEQNVSKNFAVIRQKLLETGVVEDAAIAGHATLMGGNTDNGFSWRGKPADQKLSVAHRNVSAEYIKVSGMRLIEGRNFQPDLLLESGHVIINESMAKVIGNAPVVGQVIKSPRDNEKGVLSDMTIIGVVKDFVYGDVFGNADPLIMFCKPPKNRSFIYLRMKSTPDTEKALAAIENVIRDANPGVPVEWKFVDDQFDQMYKTETLLGKVSGTFAILSILISCLGLFGLAAYTAERRTKEIGIRKVLGASVGGVALLVSAEFLQLVAISCVVAFPLAWLLMSEWLASYEYRIVVGWTVFAGAGLLAISIAIITTGFHSVRTAVANPVRSLKSE